MSHNKHLFVSDGQKDGGVEKGTVGGKKVQAKGRKRENGKYFRTIVLLIPPHRDKINITNKKTEENLY